MGTASDPGYLDHYHAQMRAEGRYGNPMPPDHWMKLNDRVAHSLSTYAQYRRYRAECGFYSGQGDEEGMAPDVWAGCEPEAQVNMVEQMRVGAERKRAEEKSLPEGWGDW
jgi:hypothetical protein